MESTWEFKKYLNIVIFFEPTSSNVKIFIKTIPESIPFYGQEPEKSIKKSTINGWGFTSKHWTFLLGKPTPISNLKSTILYKWQ